MQPFLAFMDRYDPTFRHRVRGVGDREIAEMEAVYGRPLPESYRAFLRVMGADPAGFELSYKANSTYSEVLDPLLERQRLDWCFENLRDYVIVAVGMLDGVHLALLDSVPGEPPVMRAEVTAYMTESTSLLNLMMSKAYARYSMVELPHRRLWSGTIQPHWNRAFEVLRGLGFEPLWFADDDNFVAERGSIRVMLCQGEPDRGYLDARAPDPVVLDELQPVIERELGLLARELRTSAR